MVRVLGVDPGTKSFDLAVVEDGRVVWEYSIETGRVARDPRSLLDAIREAGRVDAIAGPSGYGVPVTESRDVVDPRRFAVEVLLLSREEDIEEGVRRGDPGIMVYKALAEAVVELCRDESRRTIFIPGVVHLPTVRPGAKYNRVDLGTADKLAVTALAVYQLHRGDPARADLMVLEMGYGYNALMVVESGRVTWGLGGTSLAPGMLTAGPLDLEAVVMGGSWVRSDVFHGGVMEACGTLDPGEAAGRARSMGGECGEAYESMMEQIATVIAGIHARTGISRLVVSGRLTGLKSVIDDLASRLPGSIAVEVLQPLEGASRTKHAAHGYALVVEGLLGGSASGVVERMRIRDACGTALDHALHPRLAEARRRLQEAYRASVRNPRLCGGPA
ncbi:MAG: DUF1464 family protein [Desulfurococcales archaeon]|nr:DUF1464 family protein [Desulfurococcales archaeon]